MRIFVTGAGGLIGRAVVPCLLEAGHEVMALVRSASDITYPHPNLQWILGDVRDTEFLSRAMLGCEYAVHLAARKADEADSHDINVVGTKNIIEAGEKNNLKGIVHVSSISTKFLQKGVYGLTKQQADDVVRQSSIPSVILKLSVVYGDLSSGIIGSMVRYTKLPFVPVVGPGVSTSRPILADDVAKGIKLLLAKPFATSEYELGGPEEFTLNELAEVVGFEVHGKRVRILHIPVRIGFFLARVMSLVLSKPPITVSNIVGMNEMVSVDPAPFFARYDFRPQSFAKGLAHIKKKERERISESAAILEYVFSGRKVNDFYVRLYQKALLHYGLQSSPLDARLVQNRFLLGGFDAITKFTRPRGKFQRKLLVAAAIIETMPASSDMFLQRSQKTLSILLTFTAAGFASVLKCIVGAALLIIPNFHSKNA